MKIAVLGTGMVGQALAGRLTDLGHAVTVGTRDPQATLARTEPDGMGNPPFADLARRPPERRPRRPSPTRRPAPSSSSTPPPAARLSTCSAAAGADNLAGKVLLDISNPLDFSAGLPAQPVRQGHRLARRADPARLPRGQGRQDPQHPHRLADGRPAVARRRRSTVFVSGDDAGGQGHGGLDLLESFGHDDVIDLGDLRPPAAPRCCCRVWLRLMGALGTAHLQLQGRALSRHHTRARPCRAQLPPPVGS